jgi:hypothetical protein
MRDHLAQLATALIDPINKIFYLLRFLCFVAVVYLALHWTVRRFSTKPNSKLLWFFSVVTGPLTRPVKLWILPGAMEERILPAALLVYGLLWLLIVVIEGVFKATAS